MTDRDGNDDSGRSSSSRDPSHDGLIDFTRYSTEQLQDLRYTLDRAAWPLNYRNLSLELERRERSAHAERTPGPQLAVRFTSRDGLPGWLQAKTRRSSLYGQGSMEIGPAEIILQGWQRTWLGTPIQAEQAIRVEDIRNAVRSGNRIRLEAKRPRRLSRRFELETQTPQEAEELLARLPALQTDRGARQWLELREFNQRLLASTPKAWVTAALLAMNIAIFIAMAIAARRLSGTFDMPQLLTWGANYGPLTVNGQWWRLLSALFLHANLAHLLFNAWALWNAGRLTERLYGRWPFLFIYLASGAFASLASIAWNPANGSVGASGAIFGVLGAFLAFLTHRTTRTPAALVRAHWVSTLAFVLFNLVSSAFQPGIDNAAHVGGLLGGFVFGWILARPLDEEGRSGLAARKVLWASAVACLGVLAALWQVRGAGSQLTIPERYLRTHAWYSTGLAANLRLWEELALRARNGTMSDAELAARFERDILPFWKMADERLQREAGSVPPEERAYAAIVADYVRSRLDWSRALIDATGHQDQVRGQDALRLMQRNNLIQARLERAALRSTLEHRPRALASSAPVVKLKALLFGGGWQCVRSSDPQDPPPLPTDSRSDGPALRDAAACEAQRLFMSGQYGALDALMKRATASRNDLPDGSSTMDALYGGLSLLLFEGHLELVDALSRTADWRPATQGSIEPELLETMFFEDWAWAARGTGTRNTVSQQAWGAFAYRTEMAAESLREIAPRARNNPVWHLLSVNVGLDQSLEKEALRALFDTGVKGFPDYWPLYRSMLRILQPRWLGSHQEVNAFIREMSQKPGPGTHFERYARLYWMYALLERNDTDIFQPGLADWSGMKHGFRDLLKRYPRSDYVLNAFAGFACRSGDAEEFRALRPQLDKRFSAAAWPKELTPKLCDGKLAGKPTRQPQSPEEARKDVFAEAASAYDRRDWAALRAAGQKLIDADSSSAEGYLMVGTAEASSHRYEEARAVYRKAVALAPDDFRAWQALGDLEMRKQDYRAALDALNHALKADPQAWAALSDRAVVYDALGKRGPALADARTACRNGFGFACNLVRDWER